MVVSPVDGILLAFALLGSLSALYMIWRNCCRSTNTHAAAYEMADQLDPDELKLQQILDDSPMTFFDEGSDPEQGGAGGGTAATNRKQYYGNFGDIEQDSDEENELGSDGELESDEELNNVDVDKLESELNNGGEDDDDAGDLDGDLPEDAELNNE
mmetsp:Transcript_2352/g.3491  ORF Transcript_2352/g.3491 Transcript_2352/m.3491 type:complete len:156 (+) Transcript_2352:179-646(+)